MIGYRVRQRRAAPVEAEPAALRNERALPAWRTSALWLVAALPLYLAVFAPTFIWFARRWTRNVWSDSHGLLIVVAVAYMAYRILGAERDRKPEASAAGLAFVAVGLCMAVVDVAVRTNYLSAVGFLLTLPGLALLLLGPHRTRTLGVPLAVTWLMLPMPRDSAIHQHLRRVTAWAVEPLLQAAGIPAYRQATVIEIPRQVFVVANDCSGFSTLYASLAVALLLVVLCRSTQRRALLLVAAPLLALAANILRVLALILLSEQFGVTVLETVIHPLSGVLTFAIALGGLFWIAGPELHAREATSP